MRKITCINDNWTVYPEGQSAATENAKTLDLPYT